MSYKVAAPQREVSRDTWAGVSALLRDPLWAFEKVTNVLPSQRQISEGELYLPHMPRLH